MEIVVVLVSGYRILEPSSILLELSKLLMGLKELEGYLCQMRMVWRIGELRQQVKFMPHELLDEQSIMFRDLCLDEAD